MAQKTRKPTTRPRTKTKPKGFIDQMKDLFVTTQEVSAVDRGKPGPTIADRIGLGPDKPDKPENKRNKRRPRR